MGDAPLDGRTAPIQPWRGHSKHRLQHRASWRRLRTRRSGRHFLSVAAASGNHHVPGWVVCRARRAASNCQRSRRGRDTHGRCIHPPAAHRLLPGNAQRLCQPWHLRLRYNQPWPLALRCPPGRLALWRCARDFRQPCRASAQPAATSASHTRWIGCIVWRVARSRLSASAVWQASHATRCLSASAT